MTNVGKRSQEEMININYQLTNLSLETIRMAQEKGIIQFSRFLTTALIRPVHSTEITKGEMGLAVCTVHLLYILHPYCRFCGFLFFFLTYSLSFSCLLFFIFGSTYRLQSCISDLVSESQ